MSRSRQCPLYCGALGYDNNSFDELDGPTPALQTEQLESANKLEDAQRQEQEGAASAIQRRFRMRKEYFKKLAKNANHVTMAIAKVDMENKIGITPEGWQRDVALALQKGIRYEADVFVAKSGKSNVALLEGRTHNPFQPRMPGTPDPNFTAVEPELFARVRAACGMTLARYTAIMGLQERQTEPSLRLVSSSSAAGKSGSFFFLSPDQQCIIKSCTLEDWRTLLQVLPKYVERFEEARAEALKMGNNPNQRRSGFMETLLPRYLGLYVLRNIIGSEVRVLVMLNVFGGSQKIHRRFDLKGSTVGRKANEKERSKKSPVLKDLDWADSEKELALGEADRDRFLGALERDVRCLQSWNLMDYSLLVGIHNRDPQDEMKYEVMPVVIIEDTSRRVYVGIVDILTLYGVRKRAETFFKGQLACGKDVSCQHPKYYGERFLKFILDSVVAGTE